MVMETAANIGLQENKVRQTCERFTPGTGRQFLSGMSASEENVKSHTNGRPLFMWL